ncbi:histidine phosphatase family protein [Prescottella defluvii]|uniref:histidine phosphatase family protein n=1 Tax=Prescottella defluvii TaxID=1323361 RepID=UPI0004F27E07|nr:histidine phosphatase family protein [Prescottella defluvii]
MSVVLRLLLLAHASTEALASARFPSDEELSGRGRRELARMSTPIADHALAGPERRARDTAAALGLVSEPEAALREIDYGAWAGLPMSAIPEPDLAAWLTDPDAAPHGGESVAMLLDRVQDWLDSLADRTGRWVAVTHPSVVRAATVCALGAPASAFWRVEVRPTGVARLQGRAGRWTLRLDTPTG